MAPGRLTPGPIEAPSFGWSLKWRPIIPEGAAEYVRVALQGRDAEPQGPDRPCDQWRRRLPHLEDLADGETGCAPEMCSRIRSASATVRGP